VNEQSQGEFNVRRLLDGSLQFMCPPVFVVSAQGGLQIVRAILSELGGEVIFADPGQTIIRPPSIGGRAIAGKANGQ